MNISVRNRVDTRQVVRANLVLKRKLRRFFAACGVLMIASGLTSALVSVGSGRWVFAAIMIVLGIYLIVGVPLGSWLSVHRNREALLGEVEITLTSEGIQGRSSIATFNVPWDMVKRVYERKDLWIFVVNRLSALTLAKSALSQEQQSELADFLAARTGAGQRAGALG